MLLSSIFLATVSKVPFNVRLELAMVHILSSTIFAISRLISADVIEIYAAAIARISCLAIVGYAVLPGFDATFVGLVRACAVRTINHLHRLRSLAGI